MQLSKSRLLTSDEFGLDYTIHDKIDMHSNYIRNYTCVFDAFLEEQEWHCVCESGKCCTLLEKVAIQSTIII